MRSKIVKDIMTPLSEYETISAEATLFEAAWALKQAQQAYEQREKRHRMLLITDRRGEAVGKLSQLDVLRVLEPKKKHIEESKSLSRFGFSPNYLKPMLDLCGFWEKPLIDLCRESGRLQVKRLIHGPAKVDCIDENATLPEAIHQMAGEHHQSLLVTGKDRIVGVLRQTDLFMEVAETLSECEMSEFIES
ncbi:MAG: CBS domain-containing protein [Deltaproteobacteria bacterium]|nr:CBS domain-containing protein [Deltaproteobacteria bacterium]